MRCVRSQRGGRVPGGGRSVGTHPLRIPWVPPKGSETPKGGQFGGGRGKIPPLQPFVYHQCLVWGCRRSTQGRVLGLGTAFWGWARGWGACRLPPPVLTQGPFVPQKMEMVPVPTKSYGNFYEGDCYILLSVGCRGGGGTPGVLRGARGRASLGTRGPLSCRRANPGAASATTSTTGWARSRARTSRGRLPSTPRRWTSTWAPWPCSTARCRATRARPSVLISSRGSCTWGAQRGGGAQKGGGGDGTPLGMPPLAGLARAAEGGPGAQRREGDPKGMGNWGPGLTARSPPPDIRKGGWPRA